MQRRRWIALVVVSIPLAAVASCSTDYAGVLANSGTDASSSTDPSPEGSTAPEGGGPIGAVVNDAYTTGSRLEPSFLLVGNERQFVDWYDKKLEVHCSYRPVSGGQYRCIPLVPQGATSSGAFANAGCTAPLVGLRATEKCTAVPTMVDLGDSCSPNIHLLGASAPNAYARGAMGLCGTVVAPVNAYELGAALPLDSFIAGRIDPGETLGAELVVEIVRGEDGSSGVFRISTRQAPTACSFRAIGTDSTLRCYPTTPASPVGTFADATCTTPVFRAGKCGSPDAIGLDERNNGSSCNPGTTPGDHFELGERYNGTIWRRQEDVQTPCTNVGVISGNSDRRGSRKLDPAATFGSAVRVQSRTETRLDVTYALLPDGRRVKTGWFDTEMGVDCTFAPAADGSWRCLPVALGKVTSLYVDSTCTAQKVAGYIAPSGTAACSLEPVEKACPTGCVLPPVPRWLEGSAPNTGCELTPRKNVYALGGESTGWVVKRPNILATPVCTLLTRKEEAVHDVTLLPSTTFVGAKLPFPY